MLQAIAEFGEDCVIREPRATAGRGLSRTLHRQRVGLAFLPKAEISVWVEDERVTKSRANCRRGAQGRGDGKVFAVPTVGPGVIEL